MISEYVWSLSENVVYFGLSEKLPNGRTLIQYKGYRLVGKINPIVDLISTMGFSLLERRHLYIHMGPRIIIVFSESCHDDVIKLKHFQNYWPFVRGIHRLPANSHYKGQWRGALMFSLICVLNKQSCGWWFKTPWRSLWRHCNVNHVFTRHALWVARAWDRSW